MGFFLCKPPKCPETILLEYNEMWEIKKSQLDVSGVILAPLQGSESYSAKEISFKYLWLSCVGFTITGFSKRYDSKGL